MKKKKWPRRILAIFASLIILGIVFVFGADLYVKASTSDQILSEEALKTVAGYDCILVLGCGVRDDGTPSPMLRDRLDCALALYRAGVSKKLLLTGDHGTKGYNEVGAMKRYMLEAGVPSEDLFMDHAGFSTYESIYRAKAVFQVKTPLIVTQKYHLYRALYLANALGLDARGAAAEGENYAGQTMRDLREILARDKDFLQAIFKPAPTYLGEEIPVWGDGNETNDEEFS